MIDSSIAPSSGQCALPAAKCAHSSPVAPGGPCSLDLDLLGVEHLPFKIIHSIRARSAKPQRVNEMQGALVRYASEGAGRLGSFDALWRPHKPFQTGNTGNGLVLGGPPLSMEDGRSPDTGTRRVRVGNRARPSRMKGMEVVTMKKKRILITGAGSGFGELAAIGLAKDGHDVIAGVQNWPQATALRRCAEALGLKTLRASEMSFHSRRRTW